MRHYWDFFTKVNPKSQRSQTQPSFLPYKVVEHRCCREQHKQNRDCVFVQYTAHLIYFLVLESSQTTRTYSWMKCEKSRTTRTWMDAMYGKLLLEKYFFFELWIFHFWWKFFDRFSPFLFDGFFGNLMPSVFSWRFWLQSSLVFIYSTGVQLWRYSVGV